MAEKVGVRASLIILLVLAGILVLVAWFAWSFKARRTVPTAPKPTSQRVMPGPGPIRAT